MGSATDQQTKEEATRSVIYLVYVTIDTETTGLNPLKDELVAIGIRVDGKSKLFCRDDNIGEAEILGNFWGWLSSIPHPILVGYNFDFDWQFLKLRSLKYGLIVRHFDKYNERIDLRLILNPDRYTKGTKLGDYCEFLGIHDGDELSGSDVPTLWEQHDYDSIKKHLIFDIEKTEALLIRLRDCGLIL